MNLKNHQYTKNRQRINFYNSLSAKKESFEPISENQVKMYACGVTVYDDCHIGHAMQAIIYDSLVRYLKFRGFDVTYVRNYTDVDDKIINKSKTLNMSPKDLAEKMIESAEKDFVDLKLAPANHSPKVSTHIPQIIKLIQQIIKNDHAYATEQGNVYFRVRSKSDYGKLSKRNVDSLRKSERDIATETDKEDALDFALWKKDDTLHASWESPWGLGRPGWHIECSAMAHEYLGESFDIHGGGRDLIFPHHENEIAQSEAAFKKKLCKLLASLWPTHN